MPKPPPEQTRTEPDTVPLSVPEPESEERCTGPQIIADYLKTLPAAPGVYRMLNSDGDVIYVGKARSLKARVSNYARLGGHTNRIARMIVSTASISTLSFTPMGAVVVSFNNTAHLPEPPQDG